MYCVRNSQIHPSKWISNQSKKSSVRNEYWFFFKFSFLFSCCNLMNCASENGQKVISDIGGWFGSCFLSFFYFVISEHILVFIMVRNSLFCIYISIPNQKDKEERKKNDYYEDEDIIRLCNQVKLENKWSRQMFWQTSRLLRWKSELSFCLYKTNFTVADLYLCVFKCVCVYFFFIFQFKVGKKSCRLLAKASDASMTICQFIYQFEIEIAI